MDADFELRAGCAVRVREILRLHRTEMILRKWIVIVVLCFGPIRAEVCAQVDPVAPCGAKSTTVTLMRDAGSLLSGIVHAPRNAIRPKNLAWEIPIGVGATLLIKEADVPMSDRIQSYDLERVSSRWSNIGLAAEVGGSALAWSGGCALHQPKIAEAGATALIALGAAGALDMGMKAMFNREYPYRPHSTGDFWAGGKSFPSGHSATSFAFAAVMAQRYPHNKWVKWGALALASGVSLSRYPARKHFPSDILVGATLGYVTGAYLAGSGQR